jgi:hypothetical protein
MVASIPHIRPEVLNPLFHVSPESADMLASDSGNRSAADTNSAEFDQ